MASRSSQGHLLPKKKTTRKKASAEQKTPIYDNQISDAALIRSQPTNYSYRMLFLDSALLSDTNLNSTAIVESTNISTPTGPFRLLDLPSEMRNTIYEFVFAIDTDDEADLLLDAVPPSNAICRTSKLLYRETNQIYKEAFRSFWTQGHFTMRLDSPPEFLSLFALDSHASFDTSNINRITHLSITNIEDYPSVESDTAHHLRAGGQSWSTESYFEGEFDYRDHLIGIKEGTKEMVTGYYNKPGTRFDQPIDHKDGLQAWETEARRLLQLGPAPPLWDQLQFIAMFYVHGKDWYAKENWEEAWESPA